MLLAGGASVYIRRQHADTGPEERVEQGTVRRQGQDMAIDSTPRDTQLSSRRRGTLCA